MNLFYPDTGTPEEWNAAYYRLEDYFRAHLVTNKIHQSQTILRLLRRAAVRHALEPDKSPTKLALEETYAEIDRWFQQLSPDSEMPPQRHALSGRVSMYLLDAPAKWPNVFLAEESLVPKSFRVALQERSIQSGPDLAFSSMVPRPLDSSPVEEMLDEAWEHLGRLSVALLVGIVSLFGVAAFFYLSK